MKHALGRASSPPAGCRPPTRRPFTIAGEIRMKWSRSPGAHGTSADLLQTADLLAVGYRPGLPDDGHAPAGVPGEVHAVGLERDDGAAGRGGELAPAIVLMTMSPSTSAKLTSSTAGSACRV